MKKKRLVIVADFHSGHQYGLTPPHWWESRASKQGRFQRALWGFYSEAIDSLRPIDILIENGDAIEGKGKRSGGVELITSNISEQVRMARESIEYAAAPVVRLMHGTQYHTGEETDMEEFLVDPMRARGIDVKIDGHGFFKIKGVKNSPGFDFKHYIPNSSVPWSRFTALAKEVGWNIQWFAAQERQPRADVLIRSHVHYYGYCGVGAWLAISTPALTYNSHYGIRHCSGIVDVGLIKFDVDEEGGYTWEPILANFAALKVHAELI
jgi:hypothetical protein